MWCGVNNSALKEKEREKKAYPVLISPVRLQVRANCNLVRDDSKASLLLNLDEIGVGFGKSGLSYDSATNFLLQPLASHLGFVFLSFPGLCKKLGSFPLFFLSCLIALTFLGDDFLQCISSCWLFISSFFLLMISQHNETLVSVGISVVIQIILLLTAVVVSV